MATITEDYVSFEIAKLLKKKRFNEPCECAYSEKGQYLLSCYKGVADRRIKNSEALDFSYSVVAPTLQMAMKWLREVHGLFISIGNDDLDYNWQIFDIENRTEDLDPTCLTDSYAGYRKYELACTLAIKYCLENLI